MFDTDETNHKPIKKLFQTTLLFFGLIIFFAGCLSFVFRSNDNYRILMYHFYPHVDLQELSRGMDYSSTFDFDHKVSLFKKYFFRNVGVSIKILILSYIPFLFMSIIGFWGNVFGNTLLFTTYFMCINNFANDFWGTYVLGHLVPELMAFSITYALGFHITWHMTRKVLKKNSNEYTHFFLNPKNTLMIFLFIIVPLKFIAALLEAFL